MHWNFCSRKSFITNVSSLLLCLFFISPRLHSIPVHFIVIFCNKTAAKRKMNFSRWMRKGLWGCDVQMMFCKIFKNHFTHPHHFGNNPFKNSSYSTSFVRQGFVHHISAISAKLSEVNQSSPLLQYVRSTVRNASASEKADFHLA